MTISSSCHLSGETVRESTSVTVSNLLQLANLFLKIPGGLSRAKDILEVIRTLSPDHPEADLLQSRILDREGDSIGASQLLGEVERNEPLAVACEEIPVENDSGLQVRVTIDPDYLQTFTFRFEDNLHGFMKARQMVFMEGGSIKKSFQELNRRDDLITFTIERVAQATQVLEKLTCHDQDLFFKLGIPPSAPHTPQLTQIIDKNWEWFMMAPDWFSQDGLPLIIPPVEWIKSHIEEELYQLDLKDLIQRATGVSSDPSDVLEATLAILDSGKADLGILNVLFLEQLKKVGLTATKNSCKKYLQRLLDITDSIMSRIKFAIAPELRSLPVPTGFSKLEQVRLIICIEVVLRAVNLA